MTALPVEDEHGTRLVALDRVTERDLWDLDDPLGTSLIVVRHGSAVLLGLDRWRHRWELPGGELDDEEGPQQAAERTLYERTRVTVWGPSLVGVATFVLDAGGEAAAVYEAVVAKRPAVRASETLTELQWWDAATDAPAGSSALDIAIARWVVSGS
jgi:8-oxo-dGTP diphosphatase